MRLTINGQEIELTEEEFENVVEQLHEQGYYITSINYSFGNDEPFSEDVTLVGNTKEYLSKEGVEFINPKGEGHLPYIFVTQEALEEMLNWGQIACTGN